MNVIIGKKLSNKAFFLAVNNLGPVLTKILRNSSGLYSRFLSLIFSRFGNLQSVGSRG